MINPDAEVNRLRSFLSQRDWYQTEIDEICDLCHNDINEIILDIVSNAVAEASDYAIELGAEEFLEDLDVVEIGGGYMIGTKSGKTDYSIPERKMLPDLVKNGEVSEDGDRYKVIPVGKRSDTHQPRDIFSVLRERDQVLQDARKTLNQQSLDNRSERAQRIAGQWRGIIAQKMQQVAQSRPRSEIQSPIKKPEFRTASEKQDPDTTWVIPAKEMDMTGYLMDMNKRIQENIYQSVAFIVESYEKEFA